MKFENTLQLIDEYEKHFGDTGPAWTLAYYSKQEIKTALEMLENDDEWRTDYCNGCKMFQKLLPCRPTNSFCKSHKEQP